MCANEDRNADHQPSDAAAAAAPPPPTAAGRDAEVCLVCRVRRAGILCDRCAARSIAAGVVAALACGYTVLLATLDMPSLSDAETKLVDGRCCFVGINYHTALYLKDAPPPDERAVIGLADSAELARIAQALSGSPRPSALAEARRVLDHDDARVAEAWARARALVAIRTREIEAIADALLEGFTITTFENPGHRAAGEPPPRPIYSDTDMNVYDATSFEDWMRQRVAQWQRERSEGTETVAMRAYRDRMQAIAADDFSAVPCDRCAAPGADRVEVFGSPLGVVAFIEQELGVAVPGGRDRLLAVHAAKLGTSSLRVLVFCTSCHPGPERSVAIEPGHEAGFSRWVAFGARSAE